MNRVLILGGDGMLGHQLFNYFQSRHETRCTLRQDLATYSSYNMFSQDSCYTGVDVRMTDRLLEIFGEFHPTVIINCVGIVKQRSTAKESIPSLEINALFPHRLSVLCKAIGARLIHMSTDCVFSGKKGNYSENYQPDAEDLYGKSKFLGEVQESHCLTLRTSIIGRELSHKKSLLEWVLSQRGPVKGFKKAIYTGFTTIEMSRIIENLIVNYPEASGVYQVSSDPISKYELLLLFKEKLHLPITVVPDEDFCCDRSLDSSRFRREMQYQPPSWETMVAELRQ